MSHQAYFELSTGLAGPVRCPKGTLERIRSHVAEVEATLGLKRTKYKDNPEHWDYSHNREAMAKVDAKVLCDTVEGHNAEVRCFYERLAEWSKSPVEDGETIAPEDTATFWCGLSLLDVPPERWTKDYYRSRMDALYEAMRGRESGAEGMTLDAKRPLTAEQAGAIVNLIDSWLDPGDLRLSVPNGHDSLRSSEDDGYSWCEGCGAVAEEDVDERIGCCRKRGGCPLRRDYGE